MQNLFKVKIGILYVTEEWARKTKQKIFNYYGTNNILKCNKYYIKFDNGNEINFIKVKVLFNTIDLISELYDYAPFDKIILENIDSLLTTETLKRVQHYLNKQNFLVDLIDKV